MEIKDEPIESIIKIEGEKFETVVEENVLVEVPSNDPESNPIFQPIVLLERIDISKLKKSKDKPISTSRPPRRRIFTEPFKPAINKPVEKSVTKPIEPVEPPKKLKEGRKWYHCSECSAKFDLRVNLRKHFLKTHYNRKVYECHCGAMFREKCHLKGHERLKHPPATLNCRVCKRAFEQKEALLHHWKKLHYKTHGKMFTNTRSKPWKKERGVVRLHLPGPYTCDKCGAEVAYYPSMRAHWEKHLRPRYYKCDLCPKSFTWKAGVASHIRIVHVKEKEYKCEKCDFSAITARWLREHMETYHDERKECPICQKKVRVMSRHLKRHRIIPQCEIEKVECQICKLMVARKNLKGHIRRAHENLKKCDQCEESYSTRELRNHKLRSHYDGELFECHCESLFKSRHDLKVHQDTSHVLIDINCKVCDWKYRKLTSYNMHWKTKHAKTNGEKLWTMKEIESEKAKNKMK